MSPLNRKELMKITGGGIPPDVPANQNASFSPGIPPDQPAQFSVGIPPDHPGGS